MTDTVMIAFLHNITIHPQAASPARRYHVNALGSTDETQHTHLEAAISHLRDTGAFAAQVINGPEVFILTWGPLLMPWEGQSE